MYQLDIRYVRRTLLAAAVLACAGCGAQSESKTTAHAIACVANERPLSPDVIDRLLRPNIVQIVSESALGSGFILRSNEDGDVLVVTNYHVIAEGSGFSVHFVRADGKRVDVSSVEVVKTSPEHDLALLKTPRMKVYGDGLALAPASIRTGQSVVTLGYPVLKGAASEGDPTLSNGLVTSRQIDMGNRHFIETNMPLIPGASGGPVVDSCGNVVGVASAHHAGAAHVGLLVPAADVVALQRAYLTPARAPKVEVEEQVTKFLRALQRDESRRASSYLSRNFIATNVLPSFERCMNTIRYKREFMKRLFVELEKRGVDVNNLSSEDVQEISTMVGMSFTPAEMQTYRAVTEAVEKGWDAYETLQAFFAPFVDNFFGGIDSFRVEEVAAENGKQIAYVVVEDSRRPRRYRLELTHEWGDWRIDQVLVNSASGETVDTTPATPAPRGDEYNAKVSEPRRWYPVKSDQ